MTELACWEQALQDQREAEAALSAARQHGRPQRIHELLPQVRALKTRADLLLAEAVKVKCAFRDDRFVTAWVSSTQTQALEDEPGE